MSCTAIPKNKGRRQEQGEDKGGDLHSPHHTNTALLKSRSCCPARITPSRLLAQDQSPPHTQCAPENHPAPASHPAGAGMSPAVAPWGPRSLRPWRGSSRGAAVLTDGNIQPDTRCSSQHRNEEILVQAVLPLCVRAPDLTRSLASAPRLRSELLKL